MNRLGNTRPSGPEILVSAAIPKPSELRFLVPSANADAAGVQIVPSETRRTQFSFRLGAREKRRFSDAAEQCGMDPSSAARALVELVVQRLDAGGDFLDAIHELKSAWGVPRQSDLEMRLESLTKTLATFKPRGDQEALLDKIEEVERELLQHNERADTDKKRRA